jgi:hypothetical protein
MIHEEWEKLAKLPGGHNKIVRKLREIVELKGLKGYPKRVPFTDDLRRELWIASKHTLKKEIPYVAYKPDLIITLGPKPEDRIFIEYVNTEGRISENFRRCLRGMRALECVMRVRGLKARGFVLALRDSFANNYSSHGLPSSESILDIMPLALLVKRLEGRVEWHFI